MKLLRDRETLGFVALPPLVSHRPRSGPNRYVVFAAGFVAAMLLMALFS